MIMSLPQAGQLHTRHRAVPFSDVLRAFPNAKDHGKFKLLLDEKSNPKTAKSNRKGEYLTAIMHLHPGRHMCEWASKGCLAACLNTAGVPFQLKGKLRARKARTQLYRCDPAKFLARLTWELFKFTARCKRLGRKPAVRLNGTSDVPWEVVAPWLFQLFPNVQFYDYTKSAHRLGSTPANYDLTLSRSECNDTDVYAALRAGHKVAVVSRGAEDKPGEWRGFPAEDGDEDDLLFERNAGYVQLLKPKGRARHDKSGFVAE